MENFEKELGIKKKISEKVLSVLGGFIISLSPGLLEAKGVYIEKEGVLLADADKADSKELKIKKKENGEYILTHGDQEYIFGKYLKNATDLKGGLIKVYYEYKEGNWETYYFDEVTGKVIPKSNSKGKSSPTVQPEKIDGAWYLRLYNPDSDQMENIRLPDGNRDSM